MCAAIMLCIHLLALDAERAGAVDDSGSGSAQLRDNVPAYLVRQSQKEHIQRLCLRLSLRDRRVAQVRPTLQVGLSCCKRLPQVIGGTYSSQLHVRMDQQPPQELSSDIAG